MHLTDKPGTFLSVIQSHKGIIYKVANSYCHSAEDRKDLVQEIMVQLWRSFNNYNDQYKYSTWIYRVSLNVAISFYRKENRRKQISGLFPGSILEYVDTDAVGEKEDNIAILQRFITELKDLDKALMLLYLEEKSHKETGEILGISTTNVATRIARIKSILKQKFSTVKN